MEAGDDAQCALLILRRVLAYESTACSAYGIGQLGLASVDSVPVQASSSWFTFLAMGRSTLESAQLPVAL